MKNVKKIARVFGVMFLLIDGLISAQDRAISANQYPGWDISYEFEDKMHYFILEKITGKSYS